MAKPIFKERRSHLRAKRVLSIQYRLVKTNKKDFNKAWSLSTTQDMSLGGLTFYTENQYRPADILEIQVVMSGILEIFKGYGKVLRVERKKTGSYFLTAVTFVEKSGKSRPAKAYGIPASKKTTLRSASKIRK